jgi:uncharacterized protein YuzE
MGALSAVAPEFLAEVAAALASAGRADLVPQLESGLIERWTYDPDSDAGNIYLVRPRPSLHVEKLSHPVAETISFDADNGFYVDVDHDGNLFGIEYIGRPDVLAQLRRTDAL